MGYEGMLRTQPGKMISSVVVTFYAWVVAISFGAVIIDIMYARLAPGIETAFSEVADFLLLLYAVAILVAIVAIGLSWHLNAARNLFIVSLAIIFLGLLLPVFLSPLFRGDLGPALGTGIRMALSALTSILVFMGLHQFYRQQFQPT
jgi:hypothetical protein